MELTQNEKLIHQMYIAYYQRPADPEGLQYWLGQLETAGDWNAVSAAFGAPENPEYQALYGDMTREELVAELYQSSFNREAAQEEIDFWAASEHSDLNLAFAIINGAQNEDLATVENKVAFSAETVAYVETNEGYAQIDDPNALMAGIDANSDVSPEAVADAIGPIDSGNGGGTPGETIMLTANRDGLTGTENDDTFNGDVAQNQNGASANSFSTGDVLDGGAGRDKIEATLINDNIVDGGGNDGLSVNARTTNIEEAYFGVLDQDVVVDAGRMDSVDQFWSDGSDQDLIIDDVRLGSKLSVTKDITFGLRDADVDSGLSAWFDTNSLTNEGSFTANSSLVIRAADVSTETPETPLANVELEIGFTVGGETVEIVVQSTDGTYAGLRDAIDAALEEQGQGDLEVSLANPYNEVVFAGNTTTLPFTAQEIVITDPAGNEFDNVDFQAGNINPVPGGFLLAGNAAPQDPSVSTTLIESNLVLDNAGRGSTAGDVYIGGMSNSGAVVEKLNLVVDRSSKIDDLMTGSGRVGDTAFEQIEVTSTGADGNLSIADVGNVYNFDATAFEGQTLSVSGQAGVAKGSVAGADWAPNAENEAHVYNTADSNDSVTVVYSADKAAEFAGFSLGVNTGGGSDFVKLESVGTGGFNLVDQQDLVNNVVVNTGSGDDTVWTEGAGAVTISTGAGNDTVYTDNSGAQWISQDDNAATWVVNAVNQDINDLEGANFGLLSGQTVTDGNGTVNQIASVLYGAQLTVNFSGANLGGGVTSEGADDAGATAAFENGFESVVDVLEDSTQVFGDQRDINAAIMRAINEDEVLNKLLVAEAGPDHSLVIRSKIDGSFVADDLEITLSARDLSTDALSTAEQSNVVDAIRQQTGFSGYDGTAPAIQDILNGSVAAGNGLNGLGQDAAVIAQGAAVLFSVAPGTLDASAGGTLTFTIDGESVSLTEGVDFTQAGANVASTDLAGLSITVDGENYTLADNAGALEVTGPEGSALTLTDGTNSVNDAAPTTSTSDLTGTQSTADNDGNIVNAGTGDDVIVLSTSADSNEVLVFEGNFGNDTVVNFEDNAGGTAAEALDTLDFTSYLTTEQRTSSSTGGVSEERIDTTVSADATLVANEIQVATFTYVAGQNSGQNTFDALSANALLAALNGDGDFGSLVDGTSASDNAAANFGNAAGNIVGDTQYHLIAVENTANEGEYKFFQLTSVSDAGTDVDTGDFASATLVGSVDFGDTVDFTTAGIA